MATKEKDKVLYCECCGRNVLAILNERGELIITRRGHKLVVLLNAYNAAKPVP